jgi:type IV pilus assembly protein PilB
MPAGRLGELLVRENLITLQQLQAAQEQQRKTGGRLGFNLTKLGYIEESELTAFLSKQYGVPAINLSEFEIDPEVIKLVPLEVAEKHQVIPVNRAGASLIVAMADPSNIFAIDDLKFLTGLQHRGRRRVRRRHPRGHREVLRRHDQRAPS